MRRIATCNEFFDILDQIKGGQWVTIGIVTSANLTGYPSIKRKNPLTNRMKGYPDHEAFGVAEEIAALVKVSSYNMHFSNRDKISKRYGDWKKSVNAIRNAYGVPEIGSKNSYKDTNNYGGGIESYNGDNESLKGHSYAPQNIFGVKPKSIVYAVNQDGHIIQALKPEQVKQYIKKYREYSPDAASYRDSGANALMKMGAEEEKIKEYLEKIAELKFSYVNFEANSILWIAASVNGEKIVYINDNFQRAVDNINIRPEDFRAIARERYKIDLANLQEMTRRTMSNQIIRLTESDLHKIVKESVHKILVNEGLLSGFFSKKKEIQSPHVEEEPQDHVYSVKEMQWLYDNQNDLSPIEREVLKAGMWVRAMKANYHGYAKDWPNIILKDGKTFYRTKDGRIRKVGT